MSNTDLLVVYDNANQQLLPGDKVVYTTNSELEYGVVIKLNAQKSTIRQTTDSTFKEFTNSYATGVPILNRKIHKLNL